MRALARVAAALAMLCATPVLAAQAPEQKVQSAGEAIAQDASQYALQHKVDQAEAVRRLRIQQDSVSMTDAIRQEFRSRLAGISIEHEPEFRISVLLTGSEPVADRSVHVAGSAVPVVFRSGARATQQQAVAAMLIHRSKLAAELPNARGFGFDQRTGEIVLLVTSFDMRRLTPDRIKARAEAITGIPVRVRLANPEVTNMDLTGGGRLEGISGEDNKRYLCTAGFVVTDGKRTGIATAAHCPDSVSYVDAAGQRTPLEFLGHWGARYQDVQINLSPAAARPLFYADRRAGALRPVTSWRNRMSTRAGDFVCHYGETSGYTCAEVELTDYAPPGELCGGPCEPMWITVAGPGCKGGDSGGPVFMGTVALGIFKGGSGTRSTRCNFYYFMSADFLPAGWKLAYEPEPSALPERRGR